eukprot:11227345-Lingulodinium_polyedra.AAC.1
MRRLASPSVESRPTSRKLPTSGGLPSLGKVATVASCHGAAARRAPSSFHRTAQVWRATAAGHSAW